MQIRVHKPKTWDGRAATRPSKAVEFAALRKSARCAEDALGLPDRRPKVGIQLLHAPPNGREFGIRDLLAADSVLKSLDDAAFPTHLLGQFGDPQLPARAGCPAVHDPIRRLERVS